MAISSILSAAGRLAGKTGQKAISAGKSIASSSEFNRIKERAIEKAPGALWRAAGGHKVPILDAGFKYLDKQRIQGRRADRDRKKAMDAANARMDEWAKSYKQSSASQARQASASQKKAQEQLAHQGKVLENQSRNLTAENKKAIGYQTKLLVQEQGKIVKALEYQTKLLSHQQEETRKTSQESIRRLTHEKQEEKVEKAKRQNRRRQTKAEKDGAQVLHKSSTGILMQIASDVRDIKGILAKGGFGGKGGDEDSGGGLGSILGNIVSSVIGKKARGFILKGAAKLFKRVKPLRKIKSLISAGKGGLAKGARKLLGYGGKEVVEHEGAKVLQLGYEGAKVAKAGTGLAKIGAATPKILRLGYDGAKAAEVAKSGLPMVLSSSKALSTTAGAAAKGGLKAAESTVGTGVAAIARNGAVEKSLASKGLMAAGKGLIKEEGIKGIAKLGGKALGKTLLKKIPLIGLLAGVGFGINRAMKGDWVGAGLEIASGAASTIPGAGTAASLGIDAALIARDIKKSGDGAPEAGSATDKLAVKTKADTPVDMGTKPLMKTAAPDPSVVKPVLKAPVPIDFTKTKPFPVTASSSTQSPGQRVADILQQMLSAMTDEKIGIFTRPVKDALQDDSFQGQGPGITNDYNASGQGGGSSSGGMRPTLTPGLPTSTDKLAPEGSITAMGNYGKSARKATDIPFAADGALPGLSVSQTKALASDTAYTESRGNKDSENKYGYIGKYQFGADALSDQGLVDTDALKAAKKKSGKDWYKGGQTQFLDNDKNWKNKGGKAGFLGDEKAQDDAYMSFTKKNIEAGFRSGALTYNSTPEDIGAYAKASHLKGAGNANKFFLHGQDSADANGTSVSKYASQARQAIASADKGDPSLLNGGKNEQALAMQKQPTNHAEAITKQQNELAANSKQTPVVVPVPVASAPAAPSKGSGGTAGVHGQMVSRNPDSSIRRLTEATMSASIS